MIKTWSSWQRFPVGDGGILDAPMGPGIYEVRHTLSGRVVAFGSAKNVAGTLTRLKAQSGGSIFIRLFRRHPRLRVLDWEYRICAAENPREASALARRLLGLKRVVWRKRLSSRLAASASAW